MYVVYFNRLFIYLFSLEGGGGKGREKERQRNINWLPPTGEWTQSPGMRPDWESNQQHFGSQEDAQPTEPHQSGQHGGLLLFKSNLWNFAWIKTTRAAINLISLFFVCWRENLQLFTSLIQVLVTKWNLPTLGSKKVMSAIRHILGGSSGSRCWFSWDGKGPVATLTVLSFPFLLKTTCIQIV